MCPTLDLRFKHQSKRNSQSSSLCRVLIILCQSIQVVKGNGLKNPQEQNMTSDQRTQNIMASFWQNGFSRAARFFSQILQSDFFSSSLWATVPREILHENSRQDPPKPQQNKKRNLTYFCSWPGQKTVQKIENSFSPIDLVSTRETCHREHETA